MTEFNARFSLFATKEKKSEKSPDHTGNIEILEDEIQNVIAYLQNAEREVDYQDNRVVKIRLASWNTESKGGLAYQKGKMSPPITDTPAKAQGASSVAANDSLPF